ncbi:diguanylate cyclase domain-containing protein [Bacterioplanoides sp.]|uniref:diguanylate cyclase domain-containing protein n=1 Tax=Bacterioplanoides sp. TaxID=2066072 RepID=UPI003B00EBB0
MTQPLIIIADQTLAIQAELADLLAADATVVSAVQDEQLQYWLGSPTLKPDLLLLDRHFIDEDLAEFCLRWRANPLLRKCDVVVMGPDAAQDEAQALLAGAVDYLRKPLHPVLALARLKSQLQRRQEVARLEALSATDGLTGVANRRYLDQFLLSEWRRAQRESSSIGLIMVDLDHFKMYNDYYGHVAGDVCLQEVARALQSCVQRPCDLIARYGGEEFAVVLPSIQLSGVEVVAKRIQQAVAMLRLPHDASVTSDMVTLSMGMAWCEPAAGEDCRLLLTAADEALYTAKSEGRNRMSEAVDLASIRMLLTN